MGDWTDSFDEMSNDGIPPEKKSRTEWFSSQDTVSSQGSSCVNAYHPQTKVFNDPIHGHIELHPLCIKLIDTPQFQRLRFIKQLGACYFIYPGASHNRFEHSIGTCHLAGQLARNLQRRQPELLITDDDVLCVEIAGLCHDLGHGPFSHLFDGEFIPRTRDGCTWKHEDASLSMFDFLLSKNNLLPVFESFNLYERDRIFIKELIRGPKIDRNDPTVTDYPYKGRDKEKAFLYEIVSNKRNGIDVDKCDYFARDCYMLGIGNTFDHSRFMKFARVIKVDGEMQICVRDKEANELYDMYHIRQSLHRRAYQHKVNKIVDVMITDALVKANEYIKIPGTNGEMRRMSDCIYDMEAFTKLTDNVLHQIYISTEPELAESRSIIDDIFCRRFYKCVGESHPISNHIKADLSEITDEILACMSDENKDVDCPLEAKDLVLQLICLDYGMKDKNPLDNLRFYSKKNPDRAVQLRKTEVSQMLPEKFAEKVVLLYCRDITNNVKLIVAAQCFDSWCQQNTNEKAKMRTDWAMTPVDQKRESSITPERTDGKHKQKLFTEASTTVNK